MIWLKMKKGWKWFCEVELSELRKKRLLQGWPVIKSEALRIGRPFFESVRHWWKKCATTCCPVTWQVCCVAVVISWHSIMLHVCYSKKYLKYLLSAMRIAISDWGVGILVADPGYDAWWETWDFHWQVLQSLCFLFVGRSHSSRYVKWHIQSILIMTIKLWSAKTSSNLLVQDAILMLDRRYGTSEYPGHDRSDALTTPHDATAFFQVLGHQTFIRSWWTLVLNKRGRPTDWSVAHGESYGDSMR